MTPLLFKWIGFATGDVVFAMLWSVNLWHELDMNWFEPSLDYYGRNPRIILWSFMLFYQMVEIWKDSIVVQEIMRSNR